MAKRERKPDDPPAGLPPWMATFSDLVTLLLTFFVMLTAMASFDEVRRVDAMMNSMRAALGIDGIDPNQLMSFEGLDMAPTESVPAESLQPMQMRLRASVLAHLSNDVVAFFSQPGKLRMRLKGAAFFREGSAELHPMGYAVLAEVAKVAAETGVRVEVEGHADDLGDAVEDWKLSSARAVAVVEALRRKGPVGGDRVEASGRGAFVPAETYGANPAWNRRIELVFHTDTSPSPGVVKDIESLEVGRE